MDTVLIKENIILKQLSAADALAFHRLYNPEGAWEHAITGAKTPLEFTRHIISLCNHIFSIRMADDPAIIIGDCALHDWDKAKGEIEIGGTLLPEYWGKGIMQAAFELLIELAQQQYAVNKVVAKTETDNRKAIKFALKMGFEETGIGADTLILTKYLNANIQVDF